MINNFKIQTKKNKHNLFKPSENPSFYETAKDYEQVLPLLQEAHRACCLNHKEKEPKQPYLRLQSQSKKKGPGKRQRQSWQVLKTGYFKIQDDRKKINKEN